MKEVSRTKEIQLLSKGTKALKSLFIPKRVVSEIYGINTLMFLEACIQILNLMEFFLSYLAINMKQQKLYVIQRK
jgi:hypothetical protein